MQRHRHFALSLIGDSITQSERLLLSRQDVKGFEVNVSIWSAAGRSIIAAKVTSAALKGDVQQGKEGCRNRSSIHCLRAIIDDMGWE